MAQPVKSLPLNHYIYEVPAKAAQHLKYKAFACNVLEKICWIAFVAIAATVFALSYTGATLTGNLPFLMVGMTLSTIPLGALASTLHKWREGYTTERRIQEGIADQLKRKEDVSQFFRDQGLNIDLLPLEALRQKNATDPLSVLLPLIARFRYLEKEARETTALVADLLGDGLDRKLKEKERETGRPIPEAQKARIRLENRRIAWDRKERKAIPAALEAAIMLQIIQYPTQELSLATIGCPKTKTFEERYLERLFPPRNDIYFEFNNGPALTLETIEQDMSPRRLRGLLFV